MAAKGTLYTLIESRDIFENPDENQTAMVMRRAKAVTPDTTVEEAIY